MRHYIYIFYSLLICLCAACSQDEQTYTGPDHIQWSDTLTVLPVVDNDSVFDITISAMHTANYDRTVAVELLAQESNAIQGRHFDILNHTATIPAHQLTATIQVRGYSDNITVYDSLGFVLNLLVNEQMESPLYGTRTKVMLQRCKRFDINDFKGYAEVQSTWIYYYMSNISSRLVHVDIDTDTHNRIIIRDFYYKGYDVYLDLTDNDLLEPKLHFETQVFAPTVEAFGTIYGNGKIMMSEPSAYVSYYSSMERFIYLYTYQYVEDVGVVGTFVHVLKFISDEEAEKLIREGIDH